MADRDTFSVIPAIDVHGHYGTFLQDDGNALVNEFMSADAAAVAARAAACGVHWSIVSPLMGLLPRGRPDSVRANEEAFREIRSVPGLLQYAIVNPKQPETFEQARRMLKSPHCVGIKIHPEEHDYRISEEGSRLFEFFAEIDAPVMTHSGCPNSLPIDFVPFADEFPSVRLLLAHLGNGAGDHGRPDLQVEAIEAAKYGNVWVDTSSGRSLTPNLIEWAVSRIGSGRLLFGSDTPLYHVAMQKARIEAADIPFEDKVTILRTNAIEFFSLHRIHGVADAWPAARARP